MIQGENLGPTIGSEEIVESTDQLTTEPTEPEPIETVEHVPLGPFEQEKTESNEPVSIVNQSASHVSDRRRRKHKRKQKVILNQPIENYITLMIPITFE